MAVGRGDALRTMLLTMHPKLKPIREKVEAGQRLSFKDGLLLYEPDTPLHEIGQLGDLVRQRLNGNVAFYNINTHLNPTNVCIYRCNFCAFRADLRDPPYLKEFLGYMRERAPPPRFKKRPDVREFVELIKQQRIF